MSRVTLSAYRRSVATALALVGLLGVVSCGGSANGLSNDGGGADAGRGAKQSTLSGTATPAGQGGCSDDVSNPAAPAAHVAPGTTMSYAGVPPVSGAHWAEWPEISKTVYVADERPDLGQLVHAQEHGWTIVWYDESVADDDSAMADLKAEAAQISDAHAAKVVFMPWTSDDGDAFPGGAHVAITHWAASHGGREWRQFCATPSADAVHAFLERHPVSDSNEPNAP